MARKKNLHFRWKKFRLSLCLGGRVIATWPKASDDRYMYHLVVTKMVGDSYEPLSQDKHKIKAMILRLHAALLRAEDGPRQLSAYRQRIRLEKYMNIPEKK